MALAETAELAVKLTLGGNFAKNLTAAQRSLGKFDARLSRTEGRAFRAGQQIGTGIKRGAAIAAGGVAFLALNVEQGLDSLVELEKQTTQTNAAIKSTGGVSGQTADSIRKLSEKFESMNATIGDEVIQSAANLELAFTNIRKQAFEPTLLAALNVNTRLGRGPEGLAGTMRIVAKAINDPLKGLGGLSRLIGRFNPQVEDQVKGVLKLTKAERKQYGLLKLTNPKQAEAYKQGRIQSKLYKAQSILLKELDKRFGGAFGAGGTTTEAKVAKFKDSIEDLQRTLAAGMLPVVSNLADALSELFQDPNVQKGVAEFGKNLANLFTKDNIKSGISTLKDVFSTIAAVAGPAAAAVGTLVGWFQKIPPDLRNILIGAFAVNKLTGGLVTNILGGLKDLVVGSMTVQAANVTVVGGGGVPGGVPAGGKGGGLGGLLKLGLATTVAGAIVAVAPEIGREFAKALPDSFKGPKGFTGMSESQRRTLEGRAAMAAKMPSQDADRQALGKKQLADIALQVQRKGEQTASEVSAAKDTISSDLGATKAQVQTSGNAVQNTTRNSTTAAGNHVSGAVMASAGAIIGAIYAARPIVNVTQVTKSTTIQQRYGPGNGSAGTDALHNAGGH